MGCCGSAVEEPVRFQRPTTGINNLNEYTQAGENLDDPTLVARVREMVDSDPDNSVHQLNYAILMTQTGKKKTSEEAAAFFQRAQQCDPNYIRTYTEWACWLERSGDAAAAGQKFLEGYNLIYRNGAGHMLSADDVTHIMLFANHAEETTMKLPGSMTAGDMYRDAALQAPDSVTAQGNYGLYLLRRNDRAGAQVRLQKAAAGGDPFWNERLQEFNAAA